MPSHPINSLCPIPPINKPAQPIDQHRNNQQQRAWWVQQQEQCIFLLLLPLPTLLPLLPLKALGGATAAISICLLSPVLLLSLFLLPPPELLPPQLVEVRPRSPVRVEAAVADPGHRYSRHESLIPPTCVACTHASHATQDNECRSVRTGLREPTQKWKHSNPTHSSMRDKPLFHTFPSVSQASDRPTADKTTARPPGSRCDLLWRRRLSPIGSVIATPVVRPAPA